MSLYHSDFFCSLKISSVSISSFSASYLQQVIYPNILFKVPFFSFCFSIFCLWDFVFSHNLLFSSMQMILKSLSFWSSCWYLHFLLISRSLFLTGCWTSLPICIKFIVYKPLTHFLLQVYFLPVFVP